MEEMEVNTDRHWTEEIHEVIRATVRDELAQGKRRFEYCAIYYNWENDYGRFIVSPTGFLERELSGALNKLGEHGWELVTSDLVDTGSGPRLYLIFKKQMDK